MWAARDGNHLRDWRILYSFGPPAGSGAVRVGPSDPLARRLEFQPANKERRLVQTDWGDIDRVFSAAYASTPDLGLHFTVGGATTALRQFDSSEWVLTIPASHWFRIRADHMQKILGAHVCHIAGRQLVTVAGHEFDKIPDPLDFREQTLCLNSPFRIYDLERLEV